EKGVAHLVTSDVRAFAGKEGTGADCCMEEVKARRILKIAASVKRVQVDSIVEDDRQCGADLPLSSSGHNAAPEIGGAAEGEGAGVKAKLGRTRLIDLRSGGASADLERQRLCSWIRHRDGYGG